MSVQQYYVRSTSLYALNSYVLQLAAWNSVYCCCRMQVFGKVIRILPGGDSEGSLDHIDYYLFCMRSLAGKKPMQTLFTADGNASIPTVRPPSTPLPIAMRGFKFETENSIPPSPRLRHIYIHHTCCAVLHAVISVFGRQCVWPSPPAGRNCG